ncbi:MAG TPA: peptidase T [Chitinophagaceae bacterium]|nr:peptidase T [Chitinophagaceae bacterium]
MHIHVNATQLANRFMEYVKIDTQSDPLSKQFPTTEKQKNLSSLLVKELQDMGINDAHLDEFGYVYATIPANTSKKNVPVICYCAHVDTAPDCSGTDVKPLLHKNYDGSDIVLPDDPLQVLRINDYPYLKNHIGADIITASGKTLLGSDDKAGVAEIMEFAYYITTHPEIKHGEIKLLFTPDEEVGKGTANVNLKKLGAHYGYTLDGGEAGDLEDETFSADLVQITVHGVISHPGYAKGKMVNALKIAGEILTALPKHEWSPETTEKKEGFVHPTRIDGIAEKATIEFIIRDFDTPKLHEHEAKLKSIAEQVLRNYPNCSVEFHVQEQYRNMKEILNKHPHVIRYAEEAIGRTGLQFKTVSIRGGTDGSRLSFMGLPCPNLFAGEQAIHSKLEWIGVNDMIKAVETLIHLSMIWQEKG